MAKDALRVAGYRVEGEESLAIEQRNTHIELAIKIFEGDGTSAALCQGVFCSNGGQGDAGWPIQGEGGGHKIRDGESTSRICDTIHETGGRANGHHCIGSHTTVDDSLRSVEKDTTRGFIGVDGLRKFDCFSGEGGGFTDMDVAKAHWILEPSFTTHCPGYPSADAAVDKDEIGGELGRGKKLDIAMLRDGICEGRVDDGNCNAVSYNFATRGMYGEGIGTRT
jgi:hypothetical protein